MNRTNIVQNDVFISWTSADHELKNRIVDFLRKNGITCTESDHNCAGDFREWSREAVEKCTVFLLLYTENTTKSAYVPVEIEEFKKLDEYHNRCVPVVQSFELYKKHLPDLAERESAVFLVKKKSDDEKTDSYELTDELLEKILYNVQNLINNRFYKIYREATKPAYLRIASMLKSMRVADKELDYKKLYVRRTVKNSDNNAVSGASEFIRAKDIFFLQGPAGSGKSSYIDEIREAADDKTLVMSLSCRKLTGKSDLFSFMFDEFTRHCSNRHFYTTDDFRSLLSVRHLNLVLDGMDEIATDDGKRAFLNMVSDYYKANADTTTLFFTGRNEEDADLIAMNGQSPKRLFLQSFEEDQIKAFGENLFMLLGSEEKNNEFYVRIKDLSDEIRTNPLLLSQLMIVYDKKNEIPETVVGIYDAVCEITLSNENEVSDVPDEYKAMVTKNLSGILKRFSAERYRLQSQGKEIACAKIFASILKNKYEDARERAVFLEDYLKNRAIMKSDDSFYHKMLLEYFTAVYYYEKCFDFYGSEIEDEDTLRELFSHNTDAYWSDVLKLFLIKADSEIDGDTTTVLYNTLLSFGITEYTLLFDTAKNLIFHKKEALVSLISDILKKSAEGIYPPYGPLFWYVPEFNLYEETLSSLEALKESDCFTKALALTRDVCWIFGHFSCISEISDKYDGLTLFGKAQLSGVRKGLCELFFTGHTDIEDGQDIYPRCFNIKEAKHWAETGCGIHGRMETPFEDELNLYSHESFTELNGEFIGIVSAKYDPKQIDSILFSLPHPKICGLFLTPTENIIMESFFITIAFVKKIYIPETIEYIENYHQRKNYTILNNGIIYFKDEVIIPNDIKEIDDNAFMEFSKIKKIRLPKNLIKIGDRAFACCESIHVIDLPNNLKEIGNGAFFNCFSLTSISLPNNLTKIENQTFKNCISLPSISLSDNITEIGAEAFKNCKTLSTIKLPENLTKIDWRAFNNCKKLSSISLPKKITKIKVSTFEGCTNLSSISLPQNLTTIESNAFANCSSLAELTLPDSLTEIKKNAFVNCSSLTSIKIPDNIKNLGYRVFEGCSNLKTIENCPKGYTHKDLGVFSDCAILYRKEKLQPIIINNQTTEIENYGFHGQKNIEEIIILDSVTKIGVAAFANCSFLSSIKLSNKLTEIGSEAFKDCKRLPSINLPDSLTEIAAATFANCSALIAISLSNNLTDIGRSAFVNCCSLPSISLPKNLKRISGDAFKNCSALNSIILPDKLIEIGWGAFKGCRSLQLINIPDNLTEIGSETFADCCSLSSVSLPKNLIIIGSSAFFNCSSLLSIELPKNLTKIDWGAFADCRALKNVIIPTSVHTIGDKAFAGCTGLREISISRRFEEDLQRIFTDVDLSEVKINWI